MPSVSESIVSLEEVLDLALVLEKRAMKFYADARDNSSDPACKNFFDWLAAEEDDHYVTFLEMRARFTGNTLPGCELPSGYSNFIRLLANEATECLTLKGGGSLDEAIVHAIALERCFLEYFAKIKDLFTAEDASVIEGICREEEKHMEAIREYRAENMG